MRGGFKDFPDWTPWIYRPIEAKKHEPDGTEKRATGIVKIMKGGAVVRKEKKRGKKSKSKVLEHPS